MAPNRLRKISVLAVAVVLSSVGAGCGTSSNGEQGKSPAKIWADALAATSGANDLRVDGTIINPGEALTLHMTMSRSGDGGGTITLNGHVLHLVVASGLVYLKADNAAWHYVIGGNTVPKDAGKWEMVPLSTESPISNLAYFANSSKFLANLKTKGKLTKQAGTVQWDGHKTVVISDSTRAKLYISDTGKPYVLRLIGGTKVSYGSMEFGHYGSAPPPKAPEGAVSFT